MAMANGSCMHAYKDFTNIAATKCTLGMVNREEGEEDRLVSFLNILARDSTLRCHSTAVS